MNLGQTEMIDVHFAVLTPSLHEEKNPYGKCSYPQPHN